MALSSSFLNEWHMDFAEARWGKKTFSKAGTRWQRYHMFTVRALTIVCYISSHPWTDCCWLSIASFDLLAEPWEFTERICSCFSRDSAKGGRMASQISENVSRDCMCQCGWVSQDYSLRTTSGCCLRWAVYWPTRLVVEPWDPEGHYHVSTGTGSTVSYPET